MPKGFWIWLAEWAARYVGKTLIDITTHKAPETALPGTEPPPPPIEVPPSPGERLGLQRAFDVGESLPWKGIHFRLVSVEPTRLVLEPLAMTAARAKQRKEASRGRR
jgi:hypothetical protein